MSPGAQDLDAVNHYPNKGASQISNARVANITLSLHLRGTLRKFNDDEAEEIQ
jgi:hypothetical protein